MSVPLTKVLRHEFAPLFPHHDAVKKIVYLPLDDANLYTWVEDVLYWWRLDIKTQRTLDVVILSRLSRNA